MRNFLRIAEGINTAQLNIALWRQPGLWNAYAVRHWHPRSVHGVIDDVVLRYNKFDGLHDDFVEAVCANIAVENYPAWRALPEAAELIYPLMMSVRGLELGRVFISRMKPGQTIPTHSDIISEAEAAFPFRRAPARYYERYHIVLASSPGVVFRCGEEQVWMRQGEVWWFNNQLEHEVVNNSAEDRIHLIVDIHSQQEVYIPPYATVEDMPAGAELPK